MRDRPVGRGAAPAAVGRHHPGELIPAVVAHVPAALTGLGVGASGNGAVAVDQRRAGEARTRPEPGDSQRCADCLMGTAEGMRAYSMDLRERVVAAVDRGMTQEQAAVPFGVSVNPVGRSLTRRRNTGSLAPTAYRH